MKQKFSKAIEILNKQTKRKLKKKKIIMNQDAEQKALPIGSTKQKKEIRIRDKGDKYHAQTSIRRKEIHKTDHDDQDFWDPILR